MCEFDKEAPVVILPAEVKLWLLRQMEISPYAALGAAANCSTMNWVKEMWAKRPEFFTSEVIDLGGSRWDCDGGWFKWQTKGNGIEPPPPTEDFYESMHMLLAWYLMNNKGMPDVEMGRLVRRTQRIASALLPRKLGNALIAYMNGPDFFATPEFQKMAQNLALMLNHRVTKEERFDLVHQLALMNLSQQRQLALSLVWECARREIDTELELFMAVPYIFEEPCQFAKYYFSQVPTFEGHVMPGNLLSRKMKFKLLLRLFTELMDTWFSLSGAMRQLVLSLEKALPVYLGFSPEEGEEWFASIADAFNKHQPKIRRY